MMPGPVPAQPLPGGPPGPPGRPGRPAGGSRALPTGLPPHALWLGTVPFEEALRLQRVLHARRAASMSADRLLLLEHPPTYTLGSGWRPSHVRQPLDELAAHAAVAHADRGGSVTYHGPGQLVAYPIVDLSGRGHDFGQYLRDLERVVLDTLAELGLQGLRRPGLTGVFVRDRKIASIGVRVARGVTMHGLALNVTNDLSPFDRIVPCGIEGCRMTSVARELAALPQDREPRHPIDAKTVAFLLATVFHKVFGQER